VSRQREDPVASEAVPAARQAPIAMPAAVPSAAAVLARASDGTSEPEHYDEIVIEISPPAATRE
jgi:hypothetical protein